MYYSNLEVELEVELDPVELDPVELVLDVLVVHGLVDGVLGRDLKKIL